MNRRLVGVVGWALWMVGACRRPVSIDEGRQLYKANGCANCHGSEGHGDGPVGRTLSRPPRDFRDARAFRNGADVQAITRTLAQGLNAEGAQMPRFDHLPEAERRAIAAFVVSLESPQGGVVP